MTSTMSPPHQRSHTSPIKCVQVQADQKECLLRVPRSHWLKSWKVSKQWIDIFRYIEIILTIYIWTNNSSSYYIVCKQWPRPFYIVGKQWPLPLLQTALIQNWNFKKRPTKILSKVKPIIICPRTDRRQTSHTAIRQHSLWSSSWEPVEAPDNPITRIIKPIMVANRPRRRSACERRHRSLPTWPDDVQISTIRLLVYIRGRGHPTKLRWLRGWSRSDRLYGSYRAIGVWKRDTLHPYTS